MQKKRRREEEEEDENVFISVSSRVVSGSALKSFIESAI